MRLHSRVARFLLACVRRTFVGLSGVLSFSRRRFNFNSRAIRLGATMSDKPPRKFFPRNLTARSDLVRGNPVNARPESGVDNAHPGIEFDSRALTRVFFPGLVFDFQYKLGARVVDVRPELFKPQADLTRNDIVDRPPLFLWYILGAPQQGAPVPQFIELYGRDGYEVLRTVTNLDVGPLA